MRSSMLEVAQLDFVRTARAKGLSRRQVTIGHVLRNALLPVVTILGVQMGTVLAGSVVIESVFSWPGVGSLLFDSVSSRNYPVVLGIMVLGSLVVSRPTSPSTYLHVARSAHRDPLMDRFAFLGRFSRNRGALVGAVVILVVALVAVSAPLFFPTDPLRIVGQPELWPGEDPDFPLGTDLLGRDILAMIVHGARATLLIGLFASAVATLIGVGVGATAGYFGGWIDEIMMRAAELFQTIPNLIFVLTIVVILGRRSETS